MKPHHTIIALVILFCIFCLWVQMPGEEDIQLCADATGWSKERCLVELTR